MKISDFLQFEYDCMDTQELLILVVACPQELTVDERFEVDKHLGKCSVCRKEYEQMQFVGDLLVANREYLLKSGVFNDINAYGPSVELSFEESMQIRFKARLARAVARRKRRERKLRIVKIKQFFTRVVSIAACLLIALGVWEILAGYISDNFSIEHQVAFSSSETSVKIELFTGSEFKIVPAGRAIVAVNKPEILRINNNRQMKLDVGTELSIVAYNLGCLVKLDKGEIYTEVEHDGRPFIVETAHGRAVITGTIFNIKADDKGMELAVTEGSVRFENGNDYVDVLAGYKSEIKASSSPSIPVELLVKNPESFAVSRVFPCEALLEELGVPVAQGMPVLGDIDYEEWLKDNVEWFKREFRWICEIRKTLAKEGVEVDWPQLLLESGDIWQFNYPEHSRFRIPRLIDDNILKISRLYLADHDLLNIDKTHKLTDYYSGEEAFTKWRQLAEDGLSDDAEDLTSLLSYSLHASVYFINTRTLAWMEIAGSDQYSEKARQLNPLSEQIEEAYNIRNETIALWMIEESQSSCSDNKKDKMITRLIEAIDRLALLSSKTRF